MQQPIFLKKAIRTPTKIATSTDPALINKIAVVDKVVVCFGVGVGTKG